jgi:hypothetical protein
LLIQPDRNELGDGRLNEVESLAKLKEQNNKSAEQFRIPDQDVLENREAALGWPMQPNDLIRRIQKLNPKIVVEPGGVRNAVAVRYPKLNENGELVKAYVTGFCIDMPLPEFSAVVVDARGNPVRELRGWRTILAALVRQKCLTEKQVTLTFGNANGQRAELWNKHMQQERK